MLRKHLRDLALDCFCGGFRVGSFANRATDDDVIGAGAEGLLDGHRALLVVAAGFGSGADAGGDDERLGAELAAQALRFEG
jgi:hypothetical protein